MIHVDLGDRIRQALPHAAELWIAMESRIAELEAAEMPKVRGGTIQETPTTDGFWLSLIYSFGQPDGTVKVCRVRACWDPYGTETGAKVVTDIWFHARERFWEHMINDTAPDKRVIINNEHYVLGDGSEEPGPGNGYGGRRFLIQFADGRQVTTRDLWAQGIIPPIFRSRLPNNATFVTSFSVEGG